MVLTSSVYVTTIIVLDFQMRHPHCVLQYLEIHAI